MTRYPIQELSVDAAYRRVQSDRHQRFEAEVAAGPIVDNAGHLTVIGQLEYDGPRCERCEDTPVDDEGVPCADCLAEIGDDHWACPRCPAHWYRLDQSHDAWAERLPVVQAAHLARHDRETGAAA